jgi:hypothetical protein
VKRDQPRQDLACRPAKDRTIQVEKEQRLRDL